MKHGLAGIGAYWCMVEMLYEEWWVLMLSECERIAFELRVSCEMIESIVNDFDLFRNDWKWFYSKSILDRIEQRNIKSEKARNSAEKRWKDKWIDANALRTQSEGNAIKERKGKEIKEKKISEEKRNGNKKKIEEKIENLPEWVRKDFFEFLLEHINFIEEEYSDKKIESIENKVKEFWELLWVKIASLEIESFISHHRNNKTVFKDTIGRLNTWLANKIK